MAGSVKQEPRGGTGRASRAFQQSLNDLSRAGRDYTLISVDGSIGGQTLDAYRALEKRRGRVKACELTLKLLDGYQAAHYTTLAKNPGQASFLVGWLDQSHWQRARESLC